MANNLPSNNAATSREQLLNKKRCAANTTHFFNESEQRLKRFKGLTNDEIKLKQRPLLPNSECIPMSPITELSNNFSDTDLSTPKNRELQHNKRLLNFRVLYNEFELDNANEAIEFKQTDEGAVTQNTKKLHSFNSLSSSVYSASDTNSLDEDYITLLELENNAEDENYEMQKLPNDLDTLLSGKLKMRQEINDQEPNTYVMRRPAARRCLSLLDPHKTEIQQTNNKKNSDSNNNYNKSIKCAIATSEPNKTCDTKLSTKTNAVSSNKKIKRELRKAMSMDDAEIMSALARSEQIGEPELIGDLSKPCALPLLKQGRRHRDLRTISCNTLARLLNGEYASLINSYQIIDCRYPYEYAGGHIRGAKNIYTPEQIMNFFPVHTNSKQDLDRNIIIFHCEFSSERGPKLLRFLRNNDRASNTLEYPALHYPELYLLHNGYKEFYEQHAELCEPINYVPMLAPAFNEQYRHFRNESKSWQGDTALIGNNVRQKKTRSRFVLANVN